MDQYSTNKWLHLAYLCTSNIKILCYSPVYSVSDESGSITGLKTNIFVKIVYIPSNFFKIKAYKIELHFYSAKRDSVTKFLF